jgi:hypothetical protein
MTIGGLVQPGTLAHVRPKPRAVHVLESAVITPATPQTDGAREE